MAFLVAAAASCALIAISCSGKPACGPGSCPGCCDSKGQCQSGNAQSACGSSGFACQSCSLQQICSGGLCTQLAGGSGGGGGTSSCGPSNCGGCCQNGACQNGTANTACGRSGTTCFVCGSSQFCSNGSCLGGAGGGSGSCNASNCSNGCCDSFGICQAGTANSACGSNANLCVTCVSNQFCQSGVCVFGSGSPNVGATCASSGDCTVADGGAICLNQTTTGVNFPGGYCSGFCNTSADCGSGATCGSGICFQSCPSLFGGQSTCRAQYVCGFDNPDGGPAFSVCWPQCQLVGCPSSKTCQSSGYCQ